MLMAAMNIRTEEESSEAFDVSVDFIQHFPPSAFAVLVGYTDEKGSLHWCRVICFVPADKID
jgi:hypothetical protein